MNEIKVKICGIREPSTAIEAEKNGADYIGIVFCKKSKRCVSIKESLEILNSLNLQQIPLHFLRMTIRIM